MSKLNLIFKKSGMSIKKSKKSTKKASESISTRLRLIMKTGVFKLGYKSTLKSLRLGKSKLVIISNNCPPVHRTEIEYYAMLSSAQIHHFTGSNLDLAGACGM